MLTSWTLRVKHARPIRLPRYSVLDFQKGNDCWFCLFLQEKKALFAIDFLHWIRAVSLFCLAFNFVFKLDFASFPD